MERQSEDFIANIRDYSQSTLVEIEKMREKITELDFNVNIRTAKLATHENQITEIMARLRMVEKMSDDL